MGRISLEGEEDAGLMGGAGPEGKPGCRKTTGRPPEDDQTAKIALVDNHEVGDRTGTPLQDSRGRFTFI